MWGGELSVARTAMIDLEVFDREPLDGFEDEVNEIVFWHPVTKIGTTPDFFPLKFKVVQSEWPL